MAVDALGIPGTMRVASAIWTILARREGAIALLLATGVFSIVQSGTPNIIGVDGYYHVKVAALMRERGPRLDFPWLQLTILGPDRYADHHFLFHALQVPFTLGDPRTGAKMAAVLFAAAGLYISYAFMVRQGVRYPLLWLMAMLGASQSFLWRQSMARPQGLFLALLVLAIWAVFQRRPVLLIPLGFAAAWLFDGFPLLWAVPIVAVMAVLVLWVLGRLLDAREQWQVNGRRELLIAVSAVGATTFGIALGLVTHPYFPRHLEFAMLHLLPKAQVGMEIDARVGAEWYPFTPMGFLIRAGPATALCVAGLIPPIAALWRRRLPDWRTLALGALALGLLGMTARSQRIIEYFPAIATLFCAWSWSREGVHLGNRAAQLIPRWGRRGLMGLTLLLGVGLVWNVHEARKESKISQDWQAYRAPAEWLAQHTPAEARVFTASWDDFPRLFYWNSHNTYLVGLDPTYMALYDQELFDLWRRVSSGRIPAPSSVIKETFGADYVFVDRRRTAFLRAALADPNMDTAYRSSAAVVLRIRPPVR